MRQRRGLVGILVAVAAVYGASRILLTPEARRHVTDAGKDILNLARTCLDQSLSVAAPSVDVQELERRRKDIESQWEQLIQA
ncbi:hypothetical protein [Olsenella sp. HMSC062G07]|uniref:hypothetical protein n=1 Tax=Olsenella sp. HMSC062G07 TaxID=1739330 RepID=UPI0008A13F29|nr:hypothetical protein [Olsenella sp. HMSC062G07]OFK22249.1 hypothetical protein HMPREF2826_02245 [Olsenella sp. HMSC062G07]